VFSCRIFVLALPESVGFDGVLVTTLGEEDIVTMRASPSLNPNSFRVALPSLYGLGGYPPDTKRWAVSTTGMVMTNMAMYCTIYNFSTRQVDQLA
jgi:hypothetical protein